MENHGFGRRPGELRDTERVTMTHVTEMLAMRSLRNQLIVQVFLPIVALTTILVWTTFTTVEGLVENRLEKEIELVARSLRMPVEGALMSGDYRRLQEALGGVFQIGRVYGAYVYDAGGRRIAVAGEAVPGPREQIQAAELVALGEERGLYEDLAGEPVYSYFVPLTGTGGRIDGLLQVVRAESDIAVRLAQIRSTGTIALIAVVIVMLLLLVMGHRRAVMRPVEGLLADMQQVERGDLTWRATERGAREFAGLARGLNRMLDALKRAEAEVARRRRAEIRMLDRLRAQERDAALGRFSAGVVHELGAPLTVIDGDARRLESGTLDDDGRRRAVRIRSQVDRTRRLIRQLMKFVRDEARTREPVRIEAVMDNAIAGARPEAESRGIELVRESPDTTTAPVPAYASRLEQALLNLIRNAVQLAHSRVLVHCRDSGDALTLVVEDDGPGVEPDARERIFEPFHSDRPAGTGLGLAIVRSVAEEHGGRVAVDRSERLGGSRFALQLPREVTRE